MTSGASNDPRVALVGFGSSSYPSIDQELDFTEDPALLANALSMLELNGGAENGYTALIDIFDNSTPDVQLSYSPDPNRQVCVVVFTDEPAYEYFSGVDAADVLSAKPQNFAIIPIVQYQSTIDSYEAVSSIPGPAGSKHLDLLQFNNNPQTAIDLIVEACIEALPCPNCSEDYMPSCDFDCPCTQINTGQCRDFYDHMCICPSGTLPSPGCDIPDLVNTNPDPCPCVRESDGGEKPCWRPDFPMYYYAGLCYPESGCSHPNAIRCE